MQVWLSAVSISRQSSPTSCFWSPESSKGCWRHWPPPPPRPWTSCWPGPRSATVWTSWSCLVRPGDASLRYRSGTSHWTLYNLCGINGKLYANSYKNIANLHNIYKNVCTWHVLWYKRLFYLLMVNVVTDTSRLADKDATLITTKLCTSVLEPNLKYQKYLEMGSKLNFNFIVELFLYILHLISVYKTTMTLNFSETSWMWN